MKNIILAISILAAMACADTFEPTHVFNGKWYVCESYKTNSNGDTVEIFIPNSKEFKKWGLARHTNTNRYYSNRVLNYNQLIGHGSFASYFDESYEIHTADRHEIRFSTINEDKELVSRYITLNDKGCPIAMYSSTSGRLIREYHNDSLCNPIGDKYQYDEKGRLVAFYHTAYDTNGRATNRVFDDHNETHAYKLDSLGRTTYDVWWNHYPAKDTTKVFRQYYKYFEKGQTTYKCYVDMHDAPVTEIEYDAWAWDNNESEWIKRFDAGFIDEDVRRKR